MDGAAVATALAAGVPATIAALAAYRKSAHAVRKIGAPTRAEQKRLDARTPPNIDAADLSVNTTLSIIHADIIDVRDEVQELRTDLSDHMRDSAREREELRREIRDHVLNPKPRRPGQR